MANCDDLNDLLPLDNCYNFAQQSQLWNTIRDIVCTSCTITVPSGTSQSQFMCFWESAGGLPDPEICPVLTVIEGCDLWMGANDPLNCDLGECPAVDGTGTDWIEVGGDIPIGGLRAVFYATDMIEPAAYVAYGVSGIAMQYQNILLEDLGSGDYNNSVGVSRWTCNKSGFYRFTYSYSIRINVSGWTYNCAPGSASILTVLGVLRASFSSSAVIAQGQQVISTTGGPITANFYMPYQGWGFAPGLPAGVNASDVQGGFETGHIYLEAGQYVDFIGNSSNTGCAGSGTKEWRFSNDAYVPHAAYMLIEEVQL